MTKVETKKSTTTKRGLGRGLGALMSEPVVPINKARTTKVASELKHKSEASNASPKYIPIEKIEPNSSQPRKHFDEKELQELSNSILQLGVIQPITVRPRSGATLESGPYEIVAGERRWRASKLAKLTEVPVVIRDLSDWETLEIALVENVQRSDLNPVDEAKAYKALMDQYSLTQQAVAERIGKDRATVANFIRILGLKDSVLELLKSGELSMGHAKAIAGVKDSSAQASLAKRTVGEDLSVRALELLVSQAKVLDGQKSAALRGRAGINQRANRSGISNSEFPEVVDRLRKKLGTKVSIRHTSKGRGKIEIEYFSEAELGRIVDTVEG